MTSTIRPGATGPTPATEPARKPYSPTPWAKSKSRCPVIAPAASIRRIVRKHQRRLTRVDEIVLSLYAKGLTTGEIAAHFDELYEAKISPDTISRITDKIIADMADWVSRPLESIYAAIFIDALSVKVRDGQVRQSISFSPRLLRYAFAAHRHRRRRPRFSPSAPRRWAPPPRSV